MNIPPTIGGLRATINAITKAWNKDKARVWDHKLTIERLKLELRTARSTIAYLKETKHYHE